MDKIEATAQILSQNGLIIFPTETVFGMGCLVTSKKAIKRLYEIKGRSKTKPTSIVVSSLEKAREYGHFDEAAEKLTRKFWPGPITLVLKATKKVPLEIQGPNSTIGIRVPNNHFLLALLSRVNEALLAPSANFSGKTPVSKLSQVDTRLKDLVDYVVDEACRGEKPSTVIDLTRKKWTVLREGPISFDQIEGALANG